MLYITARQYDIVMADAPRRSASSPRHPARRLWLLALGVLSLHALDIALRAGVSERVGIAVYPIATAIASAWLIYRHRSVLVMRDYVSASLLAVFVLIATYGRGDVNWSELGLWAFGGTLGSLLIFRWLAITQYLRGLGRIVSWPTTLAAGILVGAVLAFVNTALDPERGAPVWEHLHTWLVYGLGAGLLEEVGIRLFIFALICYALGRLPRTNIEMIVTYLLLIVPHSFLHLTTLAASGQWPAAIINMLMLALLFGAPLSVLLVRYGIVAAVIAHTLVDVVRFLFRGGV